MELRLGLSARPTGRCADTTALPCSPFPNSRPCLHLPQRTPIKSSPTSAPRHVSVTLDKLYKTCPFLSHDPRHDNFLTFFTINWLFAPPRAHPLLESHDLHQLMIVIILATSTSQSIFDFDNKKKILAFIKNF